MSICLASVINAKSFVSSFYDVYLSTSASPEMICQIALIKFLFNFFITFLILVTIYILHIHVTKRSAFIPEINSIVCYPSLVAIKLNTRFKYMFAIKSFEKVRICNR